MTTSEEKPLRIGIIIMATVIMALVVWVFASALTQGGPKHSEDLPITPSVPKTSLRTPTQELPKIYREVNLTHTRTLAQYYKLRAFPGAPPVIPHPVVSTSGKQCNSCHQIGGYVPTLKAYAPITPHPTYTNCQQCHVGKLTEKLFKEIDWASTRPPMRGFSALPGGPPPISHTLQLRDNCNSCHFGPGSVKEIKTPHPERTACQQCHVYRNPTIKPFTRPLLKTANTK